MLAIFKGKQPSQNASFMYRCLTLSLPEVFTPRCWLMFNILHDISHVNEICSSIFSYHSKESKPGNKMCNCQPGKQDG